jgi:hypothetical protein
LPRPISRPTRPTNAITIFYFWGERFVSVAFPISIGGPRPKHLPGIIRRTA